MRMNGAFWVLVFLSFCGRSPAEDSPHTHNEIGPYDHDLPTEATTENDAYAADTSLDILKDLSMQVEELQKENRGRVLAVSLKKVQAEEIKQLRIRSFNTNIELLKQKALMTEIRTECNDKPKYAFAAALGDGGHVGPSDRESTLVYRKVLTNIGYSYNAASGIFSAPVKGVYYFSISTFTRDKECNGCVSLFRNHERMLTACDHYSEDGSDSANNGAAIQLEKGDHAFITLHAYSKVFDDHHNRSCFRGFLLFTL